MWVKKTEKELMYEERNRNVRKLQGEYWRGIKLTPINTAILACVLMFLFVFIFTMVSDLIFGVGYGSRGEPVPRESITWSDIPDRLPKYFFMATAMGVSTAILVFFVRSAEISDKRKGTTATTTTQICQKCNNVKADDGVYTCGCEGEYILITKMKWVEPEENDKHNIV